MCKLVYELITMGIYKNSICVKSGVWICESIEGMSELIPITACT